MRILIVGNGGREHALLWKLLRDAPGATFYATRPNGGMAALCEAVEIAPNDLEALSGWAASRAIDLTVVGPEVPLAAGIVDRFRKKGLPVFGPDRDAARIESSKAFAKELMKGAGVPTADARVFTDREGARSYVSERGAPIVVKASGLAAGKGAIVCTSVDEAHAAVDAMMDDFAFGEAGREVVVEEFMEGEELSIFGISNGADVILLMPAQDHKRVGEGDTGPNTGGMGAYAPVSIATDAVLAEARTRVFEPTLQAMADAGHPFRGLLYAGLMLTSDGVKVVEFNARFGDPETQVVLPMMESSLLDLLLAAAEGARFPPYPIRWRAGAAVTTVVASGGYPEAYETGKELDLRALPDDPDLVVFHAGTAIRGGRLVSSGGRVLACTGLGDSVDQAAERSRRAAEAVAMENKYFRSDIGWRESERHRGERA